MLTKRAFALAMLNELNKGFNIARISRQAFLLFDNNQRDLEEGLREIMFDIINMEDGPEFEMTEDQFGGFVQHLL